MHILIVNNGVHEPSHLEMAFSGHEISTIHFDALSQIKLQNFDLFVLSGSSDFPVKWNEQKLSAELELIRSSTVSILGICFGFELIVVAFGGTLKMLPEKEKGILEIKSTKSDPVFNDANPVRVYEGHRWVAESLPAVLEPIAISNDGVEAVKHSSKLIYGFQFHPERFVDQTVGKKILANFIALIEK